MITLDRMALDIARAKDVPYILIVPSGVATVAQLPAKEFGYIKVG